MKIENLKPANGSKTQKLELEEVLVLVSAKLLAEDTKDNGPEVVAVLRLDLKAETSL